MSGAPYKGDEIAFEQVIVFVVGVARGLEKPALGKQSLGRRKYCGVHVHVVRVHAFRSLCMC